MMALPDAMKLGYTIDRINNDGNYEPGNMRWTTKEIQNRNRRSNRGLRYIGVSIHQNAYKGKKYKAKFISYIYFNRKHVHIGTFETAIEAAKARDKYIIDNNLSGFALNFT